MRGREGMGCTAQDCLRARLEGRAWSTGIPRPLQEKLTSVNLSTPDMGQFPKTNGAEEKGNGQTKGSPALGLRPAAESLLPYPVPWQGTDGFPLWLFKPSGSEHHTFQGSQAPTPPPSNQANASQQLNPSKQQRDRTDSKRAGWSERGRVNKD